MRFWGTQMGLGPHRALSLESLPVSPFHSQGNGSPEIVSREAPLTQVEGTLQAWSKGWFLILPQGWGQMTSQGDHGGDRRDTEERHSIRLWQQAAESLLESQGAPGCLLSPNPFLPKAESSSSGALRSVPGPPFYEERRSWSPSDHQSEAQQTWQDIRGPSCPPSSLLPLPSLVQDSDFGDPSKISPWPSMGWTVSPPKFLCLSSNPKYNVPVLWGGN